MLALDKTEHKSRSPNRAFSPKWVVQSQRARRAIIGRARPLLAIKAKSASPTITAVTSSDLNCPYVGKIEPREAKSRAARLNNALLEMMIFTLCQLKTAYEKSSQ
jgi:hypothetical protein